MQTDFPLLSAPQPWLQSLLSTVDAETKLALLQTCKALKSWLLHGQRVLLDINLDEAALCRPEVQKQQVILQQAAGIKLHARQAGYGNAGMFFSHLLVHHMSLLGGALQNISAVHLKGVVLTEVLPSCLVVACPNMKLLELESCTLNKAVQGQGHVPLPLCPQLTCLVLDLEVRPFKEALQRAAHQLPSLTTLHVCRDWDSAAWLSLLPLSAHLTQLNITTADLGDATCLCHFTELTHLDLPACILSDSLFNALLTLPRLSHITVNAIELKSSFQHCSCHWECLQVLFDCTVASLTYLPVAGIQRLEVGELELQAQDTQAVIAAASVNMAKCGGWYAPKHTLCIKDNSSVEKDDLLCLTALPLLQHIKGCWHLQLKSISEISPSFIDRLSRHIPLSCESLEFCHCTWGMRYCCFTSRGMVRPSIPLFVKRIEEWYESREVVLTIRQLPEELTRPRKQLGVLIQ